MSAINDMMLIADAIEALAFKMPAPNAYTPQFVQLAITTRRLAQEAEDERRTKIGLPIRADVGSPVTPAAPGASTPVQRPRE